MRANTRIYVLFLTINQKPPRFYVLILTNKPPFPDASIGKGYKQKVLNRKIEDLGLLSFVGMTRFELATTRPPDVYSNRAELHPELVLRVQR